MLEKNAYTILEKIKNGTCTADERAIVESWYLQWKQEDKLEISEIEFISALKSIKSQLPGNSIQKLRLYKISAAASLLLIMTLLLYFFAIKVQKQPLVQKQLVQDFNPGRNKAILTLADGSKIILDDQRGNKQIYDPSSAYYSKNKPLESSFNTIVTPRGGEYQVLLADGTHVWLNAGSSLHFPLVFNGKQRQVDLTGEAYFEVAKRKIPFIVNTPKQRVEVLGTHFNINSYSDEGSTKTTLLEGSVRISAQSSLQNLKPTPYLLHPGQQANLKDQEINISTVDTEEVIAWKNGSISFVNADIKTIMRQISRWYDIDIKYHAATPERSFTGSIPRNSKLSELLKILKFSKINFSISGRELTILP